MRKIFQEEEEVVKEFADYNMHLKWNTTRDIVARETKDVDAISTKKASNFFLDEEILRNAKNLKVINVDTNTFDIGTYRKWGIDVDVATELGIYITNTPVGGEGVADKTWTLLLAAAKDLINADKFTRSGKWIESNVRHSIFLGHQVYGKTMGIVGLGYIGASVARRAKAFDMKILYYDIVRKNELEKELGVEYVDFDTLLRESDFVTLHTGPVRHLIGERELSLMKKHAFLINTSRGMNIDEVALYDALNIKKIGGAALDVFEKEPVDPDNPLLTLSNIVLSPHGLPNIERYVKMMKIGVQNIVNVCYGIMPLYLVNNEVIKIKPLKNE